MMRHTSTAAITRNLNPSGKIKGPLITAILAAGLMFAPAPALGAGGGGGAPSSGGVEARSVDVGKLYQQGVEALQAKDYKKAERSFRQVLSVAEKDPNANFLMGLTQMGLDDPKDARKFMRTAVKADGQMAQARGWLGALETQLGDPAKAAEQASALEAMKAACAGSCPKARDIDEALARIASAGEAKPAASIDPSVELAGFARTEGEAAYIAAYGAINEGRYDAALADLSRAAAVFGPHPDILTYTGFANRKLGRMDQALAYYTAALKLAPDHRGANEYLGEFHVERGDLARARQQLAKLDRICAFGCEEAEELRRWIAKAGA
jgi:Tfp pilus assembly protein PilF